MKRNKIILISVVLFILIVIVSFVLFTRQQLKQYTRNNTWVDLLVVVEADNVKTSQTKALEKNEEFTGLMAGDIVPIIPGCDFKILEIHPANEAIIEVNKAYTLPDDPTVSSVIFLDTISIREGETISMIVLDEGLVSYRVDITVKANYYR